MCFALAAIPFSYEEFNDTGALLSFIVTSSFLLGISPRARPYYCGTTPQQHQSKTLSFPGFGCRITYLFFYYCRSHMLLLVQTFSIWCALHGDRFPSLGFDCFNQPYGLLIFNISINFVCLNAFLNPCSPEENNGNYGERAESKAGKTCCPNGTIGSFLIKVKRCLISHTGTSGTK